MSTKGSTMTRRPALPARLVAGASLALFLLIFALLVFQLRSGRDPALGGAAATTQTPPPPPPPKRVLVRKLIITRVIVHLPEEDAAQPSTKVSARAPAAPAPARSVPAVAQAPAAAPAPAPAPATPLTTRSS